MTFFQTFVFLSPWNVLVGRKNPFSLQGHHMFLSPLFHCPDFSKECCILWCKTQKMQSLAPGMLSWSYSWHLEKTLQKKITRRLSWRKLQKEFGLPITSSVGSKAINFSSMWHYHKYVGMNNSLLAQSHKAIFFGALFAFKQWISSSLKHDTVPRVRNLYCFYVKNPPKPHCIMGLCK